MTELSKNSPKVFVLDLERDFPEDFRFLSTNRKLIHGEAKRLYIAFTFSTLFRRWHVLAAGDKDTVQNEIFTALCYRHKEQGVCELIITDRINQAEPMTELLSQELVVGFEALGFNATTHLDYVQHVDQVDKFFQKLSSPISGYPLPNLAQFLKDKGILTLKQLYVDQLGIPGYESEVFTHVTVTEQYPGLAWYYVLQGFRKVQKENCLLYLDKESSKRMNRCWPVNSNDNNAGGC